MVGDEEARAELGLLAASPEEVCEAVIREEGEYTTSTAPMSCGEAQMLIREINESIGNIRQKLLLLYEGAGWKALKYPSWRACVLAEFDMGGSRAYEHLQAARIETALFRNFGKVEVPESQLRALAPLKTPDLWRSAWSRVQERSKERSITASDVAEIVAAIKAEQNRPELTLVEEPIQKAKRGTARLNRTNDNVDWAWWTWNPVTGCLHDCAYCYARDIANRFYEQGFKPTFHEHRLAAPANTPVPDDADERSRRIFTCSMADLFGKWVPQEWIDAVFVEVRDNPQWEFLFLTKFPQRLAEIEWPANAWVGTTVDRQHRVAIAEKAFRGVKAGVKWLSCEPMLEPLKFSSLEMFDWVVIGGASRSSQTPEFWPPVEWMIDLYNQARAAGCKVYFKPNAFSSRNDVPKEIPRQR